MKIALKILWAFGREMFYKVRNCFAATVWFVLKIKRPPQFWDVSYQPDGWGPGRLLFMHHLSWNQKLGKEDAPLASFVDLCDLVESRGVELEKGFVEYVGLDANSKKPMKFLGGRFQVNIRQCQYDKCDIEYAEEVVKKPKLSKLCADLIGASEVKP